MKAITLWQPWATLVAIGAKQIETRAWATSHRGPLAIHAAKHSPAWALSLAVTPPFFQALADVSYPVMPCGYIVATCWLDSVFRITATNAPGEPERSFGDYTPGRWAWWLERVYRLPEPIPAKGSQGLWEWTPPANWGAVGR